MKHYRSGLVSALIALAAAGPVTAQQSSAEPDTTQKPAIELSAFVGGNVPLINLNDVPSAKFNPGLSGGLGLLYDVEKLFALRAELGFAKSNISHGDLGSALNSDSWRRVTAGLDMVVRLMVPKPATPYFTVGFGFIRFSESRGRTTTRGAGRFGAGVKYPLHPKLDVFCQANGWMYHFDSTLFAYFNKAQFDLTISTGVSARF